MAAEVKVEEELGEADVAEIERRIMELCRDSPRGITDQAIQKDIPHLTTRQRAMVFNRLLKLGRLEIRVGKGTGPIFVVRDPCAQVAGKMKGSDIKEKLVYQVIEDAGSKGLKSGDIKRRSNLPLAEVNTILKNLEDKVLVKAVRAGGAKSAKLYMLYNLQPDTSLTRAAFYADQEFVAVLGQQCRKFLQNKANKALQVQGDDSPYATVHEVWKYIRDLGISKQEVSTEEIEALLNMLIYDEKAEMSVVAVEEGTEGSVGGRLKLYRAANPCMARPAGLVKTPCGHCPVFNDCHVGGEISPSTCMYMKEWLDLRF